MNIRLHNYIRAGLAMVLIGTSSLLHAYENIYKFGSSDFSGTITTSTKAYSTYDGTIYVAVDGTGGGDSNWTIAAATQTGTAFTARAQGLPLGQYGTGLLLLDVLNVGGSERGKSAATHLTTAHNTFTNQIGLIALSGDSAATNTVMPGITEPGIIASRHGSSEHVYSDSLTHMATNTNHVFVAVHPDNITDKFANYQSARSATPTGQGIAVIRVSSSLTFSVVQGSVGLTATRLDPISPQIKIAPTSAVQSFTISDMIWNPHVSRLYVAGNGNASAASGGLFGIAVGQIGSDGLLTFSHITNWREGQNAGVTYAPAADQLGQVFAFQRSSALSQAPTLSIHRIRPLHASTDLDYLIVNGGNVKGDASGALEVAGNKVFALRISSTGTGPIYPGSIIRGDVLNETLLPNNFVGHDNRVSTTVGGSNLPWDKTLSCSDMVVVGDTVYVSGISSGGRSAVNDPGVWKSQALFDHQGLIVAWTPWERVFPVRVGGSQFDDTTCIEVDAKTGKIWRIRHKFESSTGAPPAEVTRTDWTTTSSWTDSLMSKLATDLSDGCFCALDITQSSAGIGSSSNEGNSIAIFGGNEKIVFARTASGNSNAPTLGFGAATNYKKTTLTDSGPVMSLGYGHNGGATKTNAGYFFAGTTKGLYAWALSTGIGFQGSDGVDALNTAPFSDSYGWRKIADSTMLTNTSGAVSQIISCTDDRIYFVLQDTQGTGGITDKVMELVFPDNSDITSVNPRIIAQSGIGGIPANTAFNSATIITTTASLSTFSGVEKSEGADVLIGIISTNNGIYTSTCDVRVLKGSSATSSETEWAQAISTSGISYYGLKPLKDARVGGPDGGDPLAHVPFRNTHFHGIYFADSQSNLGTFEQSRLIQAGLNQKATKWIAETGLTAVSGVHVGVDPKPNTNETTQKNKRFFLSSDSTNVNDTGFTTGFWTDGARRFFIRVNPDTSNHASIESLPYDPTFWNMTSAYSDPDLSDVKVIYWIENISGIGMLMAGTNTGVITLE